MITKNKRLVLHPQSSCILNIPQRQMKFTERPPHQTHKKKNFQMNQQPPNLSKKCVTFGKAVDPTPYKVPDISFPHPVPVFATYASF